MKYIISVLLFAIALFSFASEADASLIYITKKGEVVTKVLSFSSELSIPKANELEIKDAATGAGGETSVYLAKVDGKVSMKVGEGKEMEVTNQTQELVEIEERADVKKLMVGIKDNKFALEQEGAVALTDFPINIDPKENRLSVVTSSGRKYLAILPLEAVNTALRAKALTNLQGNLTIVEDEKDVLYELTGIRKVNLFNFYNLEVPVTAKVSASTGEVFTKDQPVWVRV